MTASISKRRRFSAGHLARLAMSCALLVFLLVSPLFAQRDEGAVRAAFVFNLTKYVEWPNLGHELVIGFVGDSETGAVLQRVVSGKISGSRTIRVVISPSEEQLSRCNILYVGYSSAKKTQSILDKIRNKNILSVGESDHFAREGGMVGLVRDGDHIQIEVNLESVQSGGLKISSRLLNLAEIVRTAKRG